MTNEFNQAELKWWMILIPLVFLGVTDRVSAVQQSESKDANTFAGYPDSTVGKRAEAFMEAYNSGKEEPLRNYLKNHMSPETLEKQPLSSLVPAFVSIFKQTGELDVVAIETSSDFEAVVKTKAKKNGVGWIDIQFSVDPEEPHHQRALGIVPGRAPTSVDYRTGKNLREIASLLQKETKAPSIAIGVIKDGQIDETVVTGVRRVDAEVKATETDRYHIGSVGKSMTAVLIGKLVELEKLSWSTTIGEVFENEKMRDEYRNVTIQQLLNHRGGIQPFVDDRQFDRNQFIRNDLSPTEQRREVLREALRRKPIAKSGQRMVYSNAGYIILGVIAEQIMNESFEKLMTQFLFEPLGLKAAGFGWPTNDQREEQPFGHANMGGNITAVDGKDIDMGHFLVPAGDMHFSIVDLANYAAFHIAGLNKNTSLLKMETIRHLHQPPAGESYAAGWMIGSAPDGSPQHFHNGSLVTFYAAVFLFPKQNAAVVVAANFGSQIESDVMKAVEAIFENELK